MQNYIFAILYGPRITSYNVCYTKLLRIFKENTIPGLVKSKQPITSIKLYPYLNKKHKNLVEPLAQAMKDYKKTLSYNFV